MFCKNIKYFSVEIENSSVWFSIKNRRSKILIPYWKKHYLTLEENFEENLESIFQLKFKTTLDQIKFSYC